MLADPDSTDSQRILVLAPSGRDAAVVQQVLGDHGMVTAVCESEERLVEHLESGAGAAFITEEALSIHGGALSTWIGLQAPWSDFPFVVLVARRVGRRPSGAMGALKGLGNVVLLERPLNAETLVTAALSAQRARARQYTARRYIAHEAEARRAEESAKAEVVAAKQALEVAVDAGELGTFHCPLPLGTMQCSRRCREHFWLSGDDAIALDRFYAIVHKEDQTQVREALQRAIAKPAPFDVAFRALSETGEERWIRARGSVYRDSSGALSRFDGVTFDITRQKLLEAEREGLLAAERQARLDAEKAGRMKDEFLATLSHELRTPLSAILGWTYLLGRRGSSVDVEKAASTIERNARAQAKLIEELLDMSRIASGNLKLNLETIDVATLFDPVVQSLRPALQAKEIVIETKVAPMAVGLFADASRLQQVVWNLVSNAVKFSETGGRIVLEAVQEQDEVVLRVIDTGIGIAPEFLPHVFKRFRQAESTESRSYGGLGLGLSIVRQLVELHGGTVMARSDGVGRGSSFEVRLPAAPAEAQAGDDENAAASDGHADGLAGLRILVVDDDDDGREMISTLLGDRGADVVQVASAEAALHELAQAVPDLLISDIGMPRMDGYELLRRVRSHERSEVVGVPALALTAFARAEDATKAHEAGFDAHLPKPIEPARLLASIVRLMKVRHA